MQINFKKPLVELVQSSGIRPLNPLPAGEVWVSGIQLDSRKVTPGDLFVALPGGSSDGHAYIRAAAERGAVAAIGFHPVETVAAPIPYLQVEDSRSALAWLSAAAYDFPARSLTVIGVTGTDGKTTTSNFLYQILLAAGLRAGMISTVNAIIGQEELDTGFHVTTPEAPDVQRYLALMRTAGLTHVVLESTSHGLAQDRVTACEFDLGVVTNITHEHLDYHKTYTNYFSAKARLFDHLQHTLPKPQGNPRLAVLNFDDRSYTGLHERIQTPQVSYGLTDQADVSATDIVHTPGAMHFMVHLPDGRTQLIQSDFIGDYNVSNILAAFSAAVIGLGIDPAAAARGIAALQAVPGRMERIDLGQDFSAIVDFAHTPNALKVTLETARKITQGRVIAVFGSAGLRDREKRRLMAAESARLADISILTAEDPRTESLNQILAEMAAAAAAQGGVEGQNFFRVPDRREALRLAVRLAQPGDLVLALGKGHEQSMCFGVTEYAWDDRSALRAALGEHLHLEGENMPYLPAVDD